MKEICVVHLVRSHNGIETFRRFLESYRANFGGIEHDLLILFKGFNQPIDTAAHRKLLTAFQYKTLNVSDEGFDITAYFFAVRKYAGEYRYFCFLNSFSVIQDREWLSKLYQNIIKPGVGLAGATGSWCSGNTHSRTLLRNLVKFVLGMPQEKSETNTKIKKSLFTPHKSPISVAKSAWNHLQAIIQFGTYPNYHVRTNAFIISGKLMKSLKSPVMKTKMDAYRFESGKKGLTQQIFKIGKRVVVVGKNGVGYEKEAWHESRTFWQSEQENLLVADNQTRDYQDGSPERRNYLHSAAWGIGAQRGNNG